jgi:hypothetical protein
MTRYGLYPAFIKVNYHSLFGNHTMTIPTLPWSDTPNVGGAGSLPQWDSGMIDVYDMMSTYVDLLGDIMPDTIMFDDFIVFKYDDPDGLPHPVAGKALGIPGLLSEDSVRAASATLNFRTTSFHPFKVVLLDTVPAADFRDTLPADFSVGQQALVDFLLGNDHGIAGRDGNQPYQAISITYNINDKLKQQ